MVETKNKSSKRINKNIEEKMDIVNYYSTTLFNITWENYIKQEKLTSP